jgi:hypothetical protein
MSAEQVMQLNFPPMLIKSNGQRAADAEQICKESWKGKECPRKGKGCRYRHISKDEFQAELDSGEAEAVPRPNAPPPPPPRQGAPPSSFSASSSAETAVDARLRLLEENFSKQTESLLAMNNKLDSP